MKKNHYTTADDRRAATSEILRGLGRGPGHSAPTITAVEPRLRIEDDDFILDDFDEDDDPPRPSSSARRTPAHTRGLDPATLRQIATEVLDMFREELSSLLDLSATAANDRRLFCPICGHDGCKHYHAKDEYTVRDLVDYLGVEKSTIYTWIYHGRISRPVSENPHLWDPHVIGCFKHDNKLVFEDAVYDPEEHERLLWAQKTMLSKKRAATHAKRSAHAVRRNAARRKKPSPKKSTHTRTSRSKKR
jgi:hypothetical protein